MWVYVYHSVQQAIIKYNTLLSKFINVLLFISYR